MQCQLLPLCKRALEAAQKEGSCGRVQFDDSLIVQPPLLVDAPHALRMFTALFATMGRAAASTHETSSSQMESSGNYAGDVAHLSALLDVSHQTRMLVVLKVPPAAIDQVRCAADGRRRVRAIPTLLSRKGHHVCRLPMRKCGPQRAATCPP